MGWDTYIKPVLKTTSSGFLWRMVLTTRFFHWCTSASVAQLHGIFKSLFLAMNHHDLWSSSQSRLCIPEVDENHTKKYSGFRAFSNSAPRLLNALLQALRESWVCSSLQETRDSFLFSIVFHRLPQYAPWAWLFLGCLGTWQIDSHQALWKMTHPCPKMT